MTQERTPPYSIEAEQSVLGGLLVDNKRWEEVAPMLTQADFYRADHQLIWQGICALIGANKPCDFVTLTDYLRERGELDDAGGLSYLGDISNNTPSAANVGAYAEIVRERSFLRRLVTVGGNIAELGFRPDGTSVEDLRAAVDKMVMEATTVQTMNDPQSFSDMRSDWYDELQHRKEKKVGGMMTGLRDIDERMVGLERGDYWLVIGATGSGKTMFGLNVADYFASHNGPVLGASLEMPGKQWMSRRVASRAKVNSTFLRRPEKLNDDEEDAIVSALKQLEGLPFYVDDTPAQSVQHIRMAALRLMRKTGKKLSLLMIDYIQLMGGERRRNDNRTNELLGISRTLKALAKELDCALLVLAQVNGDDIMKRDNKRPRITDVGEAKGIAYDADHVGGIYNDSYYHKDSPHDGIMEYIGIKTRNGPTFVAELDFDPKTCTISNYNGPSRRERMPQKTNTPKKTKGAGLMTALKESTPK